MIGTPGIPRPVLEGAVRVAKPAQSLGRAACLYLALVTLASNRGIVIRTRMRLAEMIAASESETDAWISRLAKLGLLAVQVPSPYFVLRLTFWSGSGGKEAQNAEQNSSASDDIQRNVPVSGKQADPAAAAAIKNKAKRDGVQGEGAAVLAEAQKILGESDAEELADLLAQYPGPIVRRAIARVRATPARRIRKSKLALFRYLLTTFTENAHGTSPDHHAHP